MILRTSRARVHPPWITAWARGDDAGRRVLGPHATAPALVDHAERVDAWWGGASWAHALHPVSLERDFDTNALVVLAGQQPVLGGGPALVVHKAATAVALARSTSELLGRAVVPVFLLATQDNDASEVDHLDVFDSSSNTLRRIRCPITPGHDTFDRSTWNPAVYSNIISSLIAFCGLSELGFASLFAAGSLGVAEHPARLLDRVFGADGLAVIEAHRLEPAGRRAIASALAEPTALSSQLERGASSLRSIGLQPPFDPQDPRPLVLESSSGRRSRVEAGDLQAIQRHERRPADFSPHAALRPVVQALGLPVLAQVAGPSELAYLAQARGLHSLFGAPAPLLVPRMEATRAPIDLVRALGERLLDEGTPVSEAERDLRAAIERFSRELGSLDPGLAPRLDRFARHVEGGARRLAEQPAWRGQAARGMRAMTRPRGRWQDSVLAWLPDAWSAGDPEGYGRFLVSLCRPLEPPVHVIHTYPDLADG